MPAPVNTFKSALARGDMLYGCWAGIGPLDGILAAGMNHPGRKNTGPLKQMIRTALAQAARATMARWRDG